MRRFLRLGVALALLLVTAAWHLGPVAAAPVHVFAIVAGGDFTCARVAHGTVKCWGDNQWGQLGNGTTVSSSVPVPVIGLQDAIAIAAGGGHACAVLAKGTVKCWGNNEAGQLGVDPQKVRSSSTIVVVRGVTDAVAIATGIQHSCALLQTGAVKCWGWNANGELGDGGGSIRSSVPVRVERVTAAVAVSAGAVGSCARTASGTVKCWGYNSFGGIGDGTRSRRYKPVAVKGLTNATAIEGVGFHSCALLESGAVKCWGYNAYGQVGNGTMTNTVTPGFVYGLANAVAVRANGNDSCALLRDATVKCWGWNQYGSLGNGSTANSPVPVAVRGLRGVVAISIGDAHSCALLKGGAVKCWGDNLYGQLGSSLARSPVPVTVVGL